MPEFCQKINSSTFEFELISPKITSDIKIHVWKGKSLNPKILTLSERYVTLKNNLQTQYANFISQEETNRFFTNWCGLHLHLFENFSLDDENKLEQINQNFVTQRVRMASAFVQSLKRKEKKNSELALFKEFVKSHDEVFKDILSDVLKFYSDELIRLQRYRRASAAYEQAHILA